MQSAGRSNEMGGHFIGRTKDIGSYWELKDICGMIECKNQRSRIGMIINTTLIYAYVYIYGSKPKQKP